MNVLQRTSHKTALIGLAAFFFAGFASSAFAEKDQDSNEPTIQSRLSEHFAYYLREGGVWRQENKDFKQGDDVPVAYIKKYSWGPGNTIVIDDTYALMEDGTCPQWTHNIMNWDREENKIHVQVFHFSGLWIRGYAVKTGEHETAAEVFGVLPDGSEMKMRDTTDLSNPDEAVVTAMFWDGENWNEGDSASWTHVSEDNKPCGFN